LRERVQEPDGADVECYNLRMDLFLRAWLARLRGVRANSATGGWRILSAIFVMFGVSFAFAQNPAQESDRLKRQAEASIEAGQFAEAIASYQEWLQAQPSSMPAEIGLAQAYRRVHNYEEARRILERTQREHPRNAEPLAALGDLDIEMQSYEDAIHHLTAALSLHPSDVETRDRLAVAYKAKGDIPSALAQIAKVLVRDPKNALAFYTRAQIYSDMNQDTGALKDAEKVVALQPQNALGDILLAKILLRAPEGASPVEAAKQCARAVQVLEPLFPDHAGDSETLYLLSHAYECAGQEDKAKETLASFEAASKAERTAKEDATQAKHLVEQANALALKDDFGGAIELLLQALAKDPTYGPANSQLAKIYYSEGDLEKASSAIGEALTRDSYQPDFLYVQGKILEKEGELDQALAAFERTTLVNPKESDAYFEMGVIYQQRNDREHALAAYKRAVELSPSDPDYQRALAGVQ
jgi:tetratricopeptide (TPR) repeat protein